MPLSEEAIAIVASNLTAAHCAGASNPFASDKPSTGNEWQKAVLALFASYLEKVRADAGDGPLSLS